MASDGQQKESRHLTRAQKRVITSCVECYRRKQKCDRLKPCNFCCSRGVPELCRYGAVSRPPVSEVQLLSPLASSKDSYAEIESTSPLELLDQIGYSSASRRGTFEAIGEPYSGVALSNTNASNTITIADTAAYRSFVAKLPSDRLTTSLIDAHFSVENWSFTILEEHRFRNHYKQFRSWLEKPFSPSNVIQTTPTLATFPALLFSVLATVLQFVPPDSEQAHALNISTASQCIRLSQQYLDFGQETIKLFERQRPTTTSIEFHLVKMAWLKNCGRGSEAWQCLGVALRQAQQIDLHRIQDDVSENAGPNLGDTLLQVWEVEYQKRLWARIFIMDSHMAVALGRPRGIHREDCSTPIPLDCDYPLEPSRTVPMSTNHSRQPPNSFSSVMFSIALGHKYHDLMTMQALKLDLKDYSRVTSLHNDVEFMLTELPPALRPSFPDTTWDRQKPQLPIARQRLLTTANIFLLALHRPYISTHIASRDATMEAAFTILQAQKALFEMVPQAQHKIYGYSFYTIDAGILLTAIILKYSTSNVDITTKALYELRQACARLGCMKDRSLIAGAGERVIRQCCSLVEASIPSPVSTTSNDYLANTLSTMDLRTVGVLQELGYHSPDQMTRDLMAMLGDPPIAQNSFPTDFVPLSDETFLYNNYMSADNTTTNNGVSYSGFTTDTV